MQEQKFQELLLASMVVDAKTTPSPALPKQQQDCQELLLASSGSSHCLSRFYASSVTLGPSSLF